MLMKKTILITGATAGIGKATAELFAQNGHTLIITGRRADRLHTLADELRNKYGIEVLTLNFDIRNNEEVEQSIASLNGSWKNIDVLVNNAGLAVGLNPIQSGVLEDWERMIDTNIKGLLYITRVVAPMMIERGKGHIINIGSIAGRETYPNGNVYCATKYAVDSLSKGMRMDLLPHGIKVSQIAPGAVETEFSVVRFKGDQKRADGVYKGYQPLSPEDIAGAVYYVATLPPHININDLLIMPTAQASAGLFNKQL
jgi:3-hydroxy acid dehydrogenase / malonic semialdehyde reductase